MAAPSPSPDIRAELLLAIDTATAAACPQLDPAERRELARQALGLRALAPWSDGRMVYVEGFAR